LMPSIRSIGSSVAFGFGHFLTAGIAHQTMHIHGVERYLAGEVRGHHDHACHPEENDVEAGSPAPTKAGSMSGVSSGQPMLRTEPVQKRTRYQYIVVALRLPDSQLQQLCAPRLHCVQRKFHRCRHTMPESDDPTTIDARYTSPECYSHWL
jgi:hypothetical protein